MSGSANNDVIFGNGMGNGIDALAGNDVVFGLGGQDTLNGNVGDDLLDGGNGADRLFGDADNDTLIGGNQADTLNGGAGVDTAQYQDFVATPAAFSLIGVAAWSLATGGAEGTDRLENVELVVDANGARTLLVGNGGFATIQAAVDAASSGDTILIAAGTYDEQVVVDGKPGLRLIGVGAVTIVPPEGTLALTGTDPNFPDFTTAALLTVLGSDGVVIDNIDIDGLSRGNDIGGLRDFVGIAVFDSAATIANVEVSNIRDPLEGEFVSGLQRGNAIVVSNTTEKAFTLTDSRIDTFQKTGLFVQGAVVTITGNEIVGEGPQPIIGQNGVQLQVVTGTVSGNTITGVGYVGTAGVVATSLFVIEGDGVSITGNTLVGGAPNGTPGGGDAGLYVIDSVDVVATGNDISAFDFAAIDQGDLEPLDGSNALNDNDFSGNVQNFGLFPQPGQAQALTASGTAGPDELNGGDGDDSLSGLDGDDTIGGEAGADTLDGGDGNDALTGGGGRDTAEYAGDPVLASDGAVWMATDAGGTDTLEGVEFVVGASGRTLLVGSGGFVSIQAAVDAAVAGDTVLIADGEYVEQVTITTSGITLRGESQDGVVIRSPAAPVVQGVYARWEPEGDLAAVVAVIDAVDVVLENLTVDGDEQANAAFAAGANDFFGVLYLRSSGAADAVVVTGARGDAAFFGVQGGEGIGVLAEDDDRQSFTLTDSRVEEFQKTGVLVSGVDLVATNNTIVGAGQTAAIAQNALQLGADTRGIVSGNTIEGIGFNGPTTNVFDASAIVVFDSAGPLAITGNTLTGSDGTDDTAVFVYDSVGVTVTGNTISDFGIGIDAEDDPDFGINVDPAALNVVAPNTLTNVAVSLVFDPESDDFGTPAPRTDAFTVAGTVGDDDLRGSGGDDTLGGSAGADTLTGRLGNDVYLTDGDEVIVEQTGEGVDRVESTGSIAALAGDVEDLTLLGSADLDGAGNGLANVITGNGGANALDGLGDADTLVGGGGDDTLDGGAGADSMAGGADNDLYRVAQTGDVVFEAVGEGDDTIESAVTFNLANAGEVENLTLVGAGALRGTGNSLDNVIVGNVGVSRLKGGTGEDTLTGGAGRDSLGGGGGADVFVFEALTDSGASIATGDTILDFRQTQDDVIDLSGIDADPSSGADDAFAFIGAAAFTAAGQARYFFQGGRTIVELSTDADPQAEMVVRLTGSVTLVGADFLL